MITTASARISSCAISQGTPASTAGRATVTVDVLTFAAAIATCHRRPRS